MPKAYFSMIALEQVVLFQMLKTLPVYFAYNFLIEIAHFEWT